MLFSALLCAALVSAGLCAGEQGRSAQQQCHGNTGTASSKAPVVESISGRFRGAWLVSRRGRPIQAFRGIRYAEPPVGKLRFQPPVMIQKYSSEVDATKDGPACPQPRYDTDEDCLRLNVYTPDTKKRLPVFVFIHPGGFYSVSSQSDLAGPQYLLDKDMVVVNINYRLGSLGFMSTGDKYSPGNNGLKDQVMALRWVQRNIAAFGGDPNLVTIAGYSAGSFSVLLHMVSPMTKGLFHRAISMSGSPISQVVIPQHQRHLAVRQAKLLNCPTDSNKAIVECLKTKTAKEFEDSFYNMFEFGADPVLLWKPVIEEDFGQERYLVQQPISYLCNGDFYAVPYIISQVEHEFIPSALAVLRNETLFTQMRDSWHQIAPISFLLSGDTDTQSDKLKQAYLGGKDLANDTATADGLGKLYSDALIGFAVHRLVNLMARHSPQPVYYYEFTYFGNNSHYRDSTTGEPIGAVHHDDLLYLFNGSRFFTPVPLSQAPDSLMVDKMTSLVYNFVRYGDPNPRPGDQILKSLHWPVIKPNKRSYLQIGEQFSVKQNLFEDRFQVWEELFPLDYDTCTNK